MSIQSQQWQQAQTWLPFFDEQPSHHIGRKSARETKLARDRAKARAEREEDAHILELADYYHPFMEA